MSGLSEKEGLQLVSDLVDELTSAFKSLAGKKHEGTFDTYRFYSAKHLHRAADGFVYLRRSGRVDASKFLVRPAIETALRLQAVQKQPDLLYRIAFSEHCQDRKLLRPAAKVVKADFQSAPIHQLWKQFKEAFKKKFPKIKAVDKEINVIEIAQKGGLGRFYDSHYRTYCQYTHGSLRASTGYLDEATDSADHRTMALCVCVALSAVTSIGAEAPNAAKLFERVRQEDPEGTKQI